MQNASLFIKKAEKFSDGCFFVRSHESSLLVNAVPFVSAVCVQQGVKSPVIQCF